MVRSDRTAPRRHDHPLPRPGQPRRDRSGRDPLPDATRCKVVWSVRNCPGDRFDVVADYADGWEGELNELLRDQGVFYEVNNQPDGLWAILISLLPWVFLLGFMIFIFMQMQGSGNRVMQFGKARARMVTKEQPKVTFNDVAGLTEAIEELQEIKDFLQNPDKYRALGAKIPKGVLLFGPPGTGKTLLAKAVAGRGRSSVPVDFRVRFRRDVRRGRRLPSSRPVRAGQEPCSRRSSSSTRSTPSVAIAVPASGGGHDEREQTLNQLLVELDGFDTNNGVIVIAATNRPDILDPALLRPGRFDRQVVIDAPDILGREGILKVHSKGKPLGADVELGVLARRTPGFTGADLANLINEAALLTARSPQDPGDDAGDGRGDRPGHLRSRAQDPGDDR